VVAKFGHVALWECPQKVCTLPIIKHKLNIIMNLNIYVGRGGSYAYSLRERDFTHAETLLQLLRSRHKIPLLFLEGNSEI
jgi:hypothetical protein